MRSMMGLLCLGLVATTSACHQRFKNEAGNLGQVRLQVITTASPTVRLGFLHVPTTGDADADLAGSVLEAVVNVGQQIKSAKLSDELARKVDPESMNTVFADALIQTLGQGPPFGVTTDPSAPLMEVELADYGLRVDHLGLPGVFHYGVRVRVYKPDGRRVYSNFLSCETDVGVSGVPLMVNNAAQLRRMTRGQVQGLFEDTAWYCGQALTQQVRRHASG